MDNTIRPPVTPAPPGAGLAAAQTAGLRPLRGRASAQAATATPLRGRSPDGGRAEAAQGQPPQTDAARLTRGPADLLDEGLGRAALPPPLELMAALEAAQRHAPLADRAVPGLGRLLAAVIDDERFKLARMMDLGR